MVAIGQDEPQRTEGDVLMSRFTRPEQTFPNLTPAEIERIRQFGEIRTYADGAFLFETGKPGPGMFVVLKGHVAITQRDGLGHVTPVIDQGPGQFVAELSQLSGHPALVDGRAAGPAARAAGRRSRTR
jgi:thioredoxin reductase (NADPH)